MYSLQRFIEKSNVLNRFLVLLLFACGPALYAQQTVITGVIKDSLNNPISNVAVSYETTGVSSDSEGKYRISVRSNSNITLIFSHVAFITLMKSLETKQEDSILFSPVLEYKTEELGEIVVEERRDEASGLVQIDPEGLNRIPGMNQGVENILMTLAGVNNSNELSTQYNVRGGNFDENLVYINGIEVYRPFLIRSGQQEGLSVINPTMVQKVRFSAGGFQAKYGDKMASVLDITYKTPKAFGISVNASLMGGSLTYEDLRSNDKLSVLLGARYRNTSMFVSKKDISSSIRPEFIDLQSYLSFLASEKFKLDFLGNISVNSYTYEPETRRTKFGSIINPQELVVLYEGQEEDRFESFFGALRGSYLINDQWNINVSTAIYHTQEQERFDIEAHYNLGEVNTDFGSDNFGEVENVSGIGSQLNHARNGVDGLVSTTSLKLNHRKENVRIEAGLTYTYEDFRDRMKEWEVIDSVGFNVRPPGSTPHEEPYEPFTGAIEPFQSIDAYNDLTINRLVGFAQYSKQGELNKGSYWMNLGVRAHHWMSRYRDEKNTNSFVSVRGQLSLKPDWEKDMLFRLSGGLYQQPPSLKEYRNSQGELVPDLDAQQSFHLVLSHHYSFSLWKRPFKLVSELFYKGLDELNRYTVDNVRIRYRANNDAEGYATGMDIRLNGEFVPGTESWVSMGLLKTEERADGKNYMARPTDQRFKFAILFQDYVPNMPHLKMFLNLVYNTGLPGGTPSYADPYAYDYRLNAYKRADLGISYILSESGNWNRSGFSKNLNYLAVGFQLFNMFDVRNSITTTWVRDAYSKQFYGIPNYMSPRIFNLTLDMKF
jgi:hypothetical protein